MPFRVNFKTSQDSINQDFIDSKGQANGICPLDANALVPISNMPLEAMHFKGMWDADTNDPALSAGVGTQGDVYIVSVAGTQDIGEGSTDFNVGDKIIYSDSDIYVRQPNPDSTDELPEGSSNLYFTTDRVQAVQLEAKMLTPTISADNYDLAGTECDYFVNLNNADDMTLTIYDYATVPISAGFNVVFRQAGNGSITLTPDNAASIETEEGLVSTGKNSCFGLLKLDNADNWYAYGINTMSLVTSHLDDATIHFTEASIDHTEITNIGTLTHAEIDSAISAAQADILTVSGSVSANTADILTLSGSVSANTADILTLSGSVSANTADIDTLEKVSFGTDITEVSASVSRTSHLNKITEVTTSAACTITIPEQELSAGDICCFAQMGAGQISIVPAVSANQDVPSRNKTNEQGDVISLICKSAVSGSEVYRIIGSVE